MVNEAERLESLKAGVGGALSLSVSWSLSWALERGLPLGWGDRDLLSSVLPLGIAVASGFLFGVTYRYIIRQDSNSHLKSGAILAFGLVRGLAQVETGLAWQPLSWLMGIWIGESVVGFAIAALVLEWCLRQGWIQPSRTP